MCQGADIRSQKTICYTTKQCACIDDHVARHFGKVTQIIEDPHTEGSKIDLLVISPSLSCDFYIIVTRGMGAYMPKFTIKEDGTKDSRADKHYELILCLDKKWVISNLCNEVDVWPLRLLLRLAHYPYINDKLLSAGMYFNNGQPFASSTQLSGVMVEELCTYFSSSARNCLLPNYEIVHFFQVLPLYQAEINFLEFYGLEHFRKNMLQDSFIVTNNRLSGIDPVTDYYSNIACDSRWYDHCNIFPNTYITTELNLNHLAWFLHFCYESDLLSTEFYDTFAAYHSDLNYDVLAPQFLNLVTNQLGGVIDRRYFNAAGEHFAVIYLDSNSFPSYVSDLEDIALNRAGGNSSYLSSYKIKSASDLPYDHNTYKVIRQVLKKRFASISNQVLYDCHNYYGLVAIFGKYLNCSTTFYPSLRDPAPILAHIRSASRMSCFQKGYPVLIEVSEEHLYRFLKLARNNVFMMSSDEFALECDEDNLIFENDFALALKEANFSLQDQFRKQLATPLSPYYYAHIFDILKPVFKRSQTAQYVFQELILIYEEKIHEFPKVIKEEFYKYVCFMEDNTHIDLGYEDKNNGADPFELNATYDKKRYEMAVPPNNLKSKQELKNRTSLALTGDDTKLDILDLKSIYRDDEQSTKPLLLAQLPVRLPYDSFGYLPYLIETPNIKLMHCLEIFAAWYHQFGAMPLVFGTHMVEFVTPQIISSEIAKQLTFEIIALCPKVRLLVDDGVLTMSRIYHDIKGSRSFTLDFSPVVKSFNKPYGY